MPAPYQECYRSLGYKRGDFPVSERLSAQSLALPMFPEITPRQIQAVARALRG